MTSTSLLLEKTRLGGANGSLVGVQGLGCMGMSEFYGASDGHESRATLDHALALGITMFDTADVYGIGANEEFLSPFVRSNRAQILIATKFGYARTPDRPDDWTIDNRPEYIRAAIDRSLRRLGVDVIDVYYMHRRNIDTPLAESVGAMADLVRAGKVRHLGLSAVSADELREAHAIHPIAALQSEWSLFTRDIESDVVPVAAALDITIVPYSPLGRGLLTGQAFAKNLEAADARRSFPRFEKQSLDANARLVGKIEGIAASHHITSAQVALAWLYTQAERLGVSVVPIPGTRKRTRLNENAAAAAIRLSEDAMRTLDPLASMVRGAAV